MENQLLEHRRNQRNSLAALIKNLQAEIKGSTLHLHTLNKEKAELNDQLEGLNSRLKSILREKQILFAKLMSAERSLADLQRQL